MLEKLNKKADLVFVGGFAMKMHGLKDSYSDIDIVVKNLDGLGKVFSYKTDSAFSKSGKRAFIPGEPKVDIFIEKELPEFELINGFKVETKKAMSEYYESILPFVKDFWKKGIEEKLKTLR